jgi:Reverse transcriptase (RNA-dependent DNA polymerase)
MVFINKQRGTTTAIKEAKLQMQLAQRTTNPPFFVFLYLKKAYDTLDRNRTAKILRGYGVRENILRFIQQIWNMDTMIPKKSGFYGQSFSATRGVQQGDIIPPTIFNIVAYAVI